MNKKNTQLTEYFGWFLEKYRDIQKELQAREAYRIIGIEKDDQGNNILKIHINGTGKEVTCKPEEIAQDDQLFVGFSKKEIRMITYLACNNINKPKYRITDYTFSAKLKKIVCRVLKGSQAEEKTAAEISANPEILKELDPLEAHRIGHLSGSESILIEEEQKKALKAQQEKTE